MDAAIDSMLSSLGPEQVEKFIGDVGTNEVAHFVTVLEAFMNRQPRLLLGEMAQLELLSPSQARSLANARSKQIFEDWSLMRSVIEHHGNIVGKRWLKKTITKRREILLSNFPSMAKSHRPDLKAYRMSNLKLSEQERKASYAWPYINIEDLTQPNLLPMFLDTRARHPPEVFVDADLDACTIGLVTRILGAPRLHGYHIHLTGRHTPDTYGEITQCRGDAIPGNISACEEGMLPQVGLFVLEIQEQIYRFLASFCKAILHDVPENEMAIASPSIQSETPYVLIKEGKLPSLVTITTEAPYRPPAGLKFERLRSIVNAKLLEIEDHLLALREDPSLLEEAILLQAEHRFEQVLDKDGKLHPRLTETELKSDFWVKVVADTLAYPLELLQVWSNFSKQMETVVKLHQQHTFSSATHPSGDFAFALYRLYFHLSQYLNSCLAVLESGVCSSPPLRQFYTRTQNGSSLSIYKYERRAETSEQGIVADLLWMLENLLLPTFSAKPKKLGIHTLIEEIELLIDQNTAAKRLITPWVAYHFSNLSIISQGLRQIELFQPIAQNLQGNVLKHSVKLSKDFNDTTKLQKTIQKLQFKGKITELGTPVKGRFEYPIEKRRTKEVVDILRRSEANLDRFWQAVDNELKQKNALPRYL